MPEEAQRAVIRHGEQGSPNREGKREKGKKGKREKGKKGIRE